MFRFSIRETATRFTPSPGNCLVAQPPANPAGLALQLYETGPGIIPSLSHVGAASLGGINDSSAFLRPAPHRL